MTSFLLALACGLAVGVPLGLALCAQPAPKRGGDGAPATPEPGLVDAAEALAVALQSHGEQAPAAQLLDALYGASTGTELLMGLRFVLRKVDRRKLGGDVVLLVRLERLLA